MDGRAFARALGCERENLFEKLKKGQGSWNLESKDRDRSEYGGWGGVRGEENPVSLRRDFALYSQSCRTL